MDILLISLEILWVVVKKLIQLAAIIFPLMIVVELLRHLRIIEWLEPICAPVMSLFRMTPRTVVPLLAGILFGILYGAGLLLDEKRKSGFTARECFLIGFFLIICHSIEDTLVLAVVGGNFFLLFFGRLLLAIGLTWLLSRLWREPKVDVSENTNKRS